MKHTLIFALILAITASAMAQTKVIAHRGYWKTEGSAQNSLRSFTKADSIGAYGSEMDVWLTADDHLVVNHDAVFKGVDFEKATLEQIRAIRLDNGEKVPTLSEYLELVASKPNTRLILELKSLSDMRRENKAAEMIAQELAEYNVLGQTDIITFSINACLAFKKVMPDGVKIYYLDGDLSPKKIKRLGLAGIDYNMSTLRAHPEWIQQAHELGLEVNVWTIRNIDDAIYFHKQGVDYITTDIPEEVLNAFK